MELGDEEPIRQVGFDEETEVVNPFKRPPPTEPPFGLSDDPPSLEKLELPEEKTAPTEKTEAQQLAEKAAEKLREEIRVLEERLKNLEAQKAAKSAKD